MSNTDALDEALLEMRVEAELRGLVLALHPVHQPPADGSTKPSFLCWCVSLSDPLDDDGVPVMSASGNDRAELLNDVKRTLEKKFPLLETMVEVRRARYRKRNRLDVCAAGLLGVCSGIAAFGALGGLWWMLDEQLGWKLALVLAGIPLGLVFVPLWETALRVRERGETVCPPIAGRKR